MCDTCRPDISTLTVILLPDDQGGGQPEEGAGGGEGQDAAC